MLKLILVIFASLIIQDAVVSSDQVPQDVHVGDSIAKNTTSNNYAVVNNTEQQQNLGKIWNRTGTLPGYSKQQPEPKLNQDRLFEQFFDGFEDDSDASASGFKKSFLRQAGVENRPVTIKNLDRLRDEMHNKNDSEESDLDDSVSLDSRDESLDDSQSSGSSQFEDDFSEDEYLKLPAQNRPTFYPTKPTFKVPQQSAFPSIKGPLPIIPVQEPVMQVRSLPMRMQTRSLQMRGARRRYPPRPRPGKDSQDDACAKMLRRRNSIQGGPQPSPVLESSQTPPVMGSPGDEKNPPQIMQNPQLQGNPAGLNSVWMPPQQQPAARPISSILNARRFNQASQIPQSNLADSSSDESAQPEPSNSGPRSLTSSIPGMFPGLTSGLSNLAPGLSGLTSSLPGMNNVTPSLRNMASSLSNGAPNLSSMTSGLTNIPTRVTSMTSGLSPTDLMPPSNLSSVSPLMNLASGLMSAFSAGSALSATLGNNSTSTRSSTDPSSYNLLSYIPNILTAASSLAPLLSSFSPSSTDGSTMNRSPLNPLSYLPNSLFGSSSASTNTDYYNRPDRRPKSRFGPGRRGKYNNGGPYDNEYDEYSDERDYYDNRPEVPSDYRYNYGYPSGPDSQRPSGRGGKNRYQYNQYDQPQ